MRLACGRVEMSVAYLIHIGGFAATAIVFFILGFFQKNPNVCWSNGVAFMISTLAYLVLYESGLEYLRWAGYALACAIFSYETSRVLGKSSSLSLTVAFLIGLTLLSGTFTILFSSVLILLYSCLAYIIAIVSMMPKSANLWMYWLYFSIVWSLYPFFFLLWWNLLLGDLTYIWILFALEIPAKYGVAIINFYLSR